MLTVAFFNFLFLGQEVPIIQNIERQSKKEKETEKKKNDLEDLIIQYHKLQI